MRLSQEKKKKDYGMRLYHFLEFLPGNKAVDSRLIAEEKRGRKW